MDQLKMNAEKEQLKKEVLEEIERQAFKNEIAKALQPNSLKTILARATHNPALLLVLSFGLTGLIASYISTSWQRREWDRQQLRLFRISAVDQKSKVPEELVQAVTKHIQDTDALFEKIRDSSSPESAEEAAATLLESGRANFLTFVTIEQKLKVWFVDPEIHQIFERIQKRPLRINSPLGAFVRNYKTTKRKGDLRELQQLLFQRYGEQQDDVKVLINKIITEIRTDIAVTS